MYKIIVVFSTIILLLACNERGEQKESVAETDKTEVTATFDPPKFEQDILENLYLAQMDIMTNPSSRAHKEKYISKAYIADKKTLITFGNARLTNPQTGNKISIALIKRAALLDAKRWASYGLLWLKNDFEPDFGKLNEVNKGVVKEIATFNKGDSLIVAIANKVN